VYTGLLYFLIPGLALELKAFIVEIEACDEEPEPEHCQRKEAALASHMYLTTFSEDNTKSVAWFKARFKSLTGYSGGYSDCEQFRGLLCP